MGMGVNKSAVEDRLRVTEFPEIRLNSPNAADIYAREFEHVDLVLIDAFRGAIPGADENDSKVRQYLDILSGASEKTETIYSIIHHAGKPKDGHADARTIARGSSGIFDACGAVYVISGEGAKPKLVKQVKTPAEATGKMVEPFYLVIEDVPVNLDPNGGVRVVHQTREQVELADGSDDRFEHDAERVLSVVGAKPGCSKQWVRTHAGIRGQRCSDVVTVLLDERCLVDRGTRLGAKLYVNETPVDGSCE